MIYLAMNKTKLGGVLGTTGLIMGIVYSFRSHKGFLEAALITTGLAVSGVLIGNQVTKFYE